MPKSSQISNVNPSDDPASRMSDVALRKKKNADAQAAFRARRANYIATLEETVTSLESVVLQLQDSCREAKQEAQELRQQNSSLRHEFREREKFWRALWQTRKAPHGSENDDLPPLPQSSHLNGHLGPPHLHQYGNESMAYRTNDDNSVCGNQYSDSTHNYHSPSIPYPGGIGDGSADNSPHPLGHRASKYPYPYNVAGTRDAPWSQNLPGASSSGDSGPTASTHSSHSPGFVESPTLTSSDMTFVGRFSGEDQKVPVNHLDNAPYVFPSSRSISPATTTPSSSSTSLTSPFPFTFPENGVHDRAEFDYRRNSGIRGEPILHGGPSEISLGGPGSDAVRYRLGTRRHDSGTPMLPGLPPLSVSDSSSQHERGSSDGDSASYSHARLRSRRGPGPMRSSRTPSPVPPPLSGTLAVIKAQAFGALRRTRARTKKTSEGAAKVAIDVLEARGIEMGVSAGSKRQRTQSEDDDTQQS